MAPTSKNVAKRGMYIWDDVTKQYVAWDGVVSATMTLGELPAGSNLIGKVGIDQVTLNANEVVVKSGAITETNSGAIKTALEILDNAIAGNEMQVDIVASVPAGTNNIGKVDVNSITSGSINGAGSPSVDSYTSASINLAAGLDQSIVAAPGANKQIWVYAIVFTVDTAGATVSIQDEDDTAITGIMPFGENGGFSMGASGNFAMPIFKVATNKALELDIVGGEVDGIISYSIISV